MGLSCRDNDAVLPYVVAIKELLESSGKKFNETKKNRWRYFYPEKEHYLSTLQEFIINEKPLIDEYLKQHSESGITDWKEQESNQNRIQEIAALISEEEHLEGDYRCSWGKSGVMLPLLNLTKRL